MLVGELLEIVINNLNVMDLVAKLIMITSVIISLLLLMFVFILIFHLSYLAYYKHSSAICLFDKFLYKKLKSKIINFFNKEKGINKIDEILMSVISEPGLKEKEKLDYYLEYVKTNADIRWKGALLTTTDITILSFIVTFIYKVTDDNHYQSDDFNSYIFIAI
jgi:hypothetical protein